MHGRPALQRAVGKREYDARLSADALHDAVPLAIVLVVVVAVVMRTVRASVLTHAVAVGFVVRGSWFVVVVVVVMVVVVVCARQAGCKKKKKWVCPPSHGRWR